MRGRLHRTALTFGVLVGLAAAPAVAQSMRPPAPAVRPATDPATAHPSAGAAIGRAAAASVGTAMQAPAGLPDFTYRSARLDDVAREPVELRIPTLGVRAAVSSAGIADDGQLDVPAEADAVVWYGAGSVPGAAGSAVIAGHVDYDGQRGSFYNLGALERGDAIRVDLDDGTTHRFVVKRVERHAKSALPTDELFTRNGSPVLTLITCGGDFDRSTGHYTDNVVVRAALRG
jgi:LPXTG-site transpeptidase (sortase) family protein